MGSLGLLASNIYIKSLINSINSLEWESIHLIPDPSKSMTMMIARTLGTMRQGTCVKRRSSQCSQLCRACVQGTCSEFGMSQHDLARGCEGNFR